MAQAERDRELPEDVNCTCNGKCLDDHSIVCKVVSSINDQLIFVEGCYNDDCAYLMAFGDSFICTCPVRKQLYFSEGR